MSRFDRRLKPEFVNKNVGVMSHGINKIRQVPKNRVRQARQTRQARQVNTIRSSSPRPGTADCKIPVAGGNKQMLGQSVFMGDSTNPNKPSIEVIEKSYDPEAGKKICFSQETIFDDISKKNAMITEKIKNTRDPNMRLLFGHEIRLNTIEVNLDMLNQIKCNEVRESQVDVENKTQIDDMLHNIEELSKNDLKKEQVIETIKNKFEEINEKIINYTDNANEKEISYNDKQREFQEELNNIKVDTISFHKKFEKQENKIKELEEKNVNLQVSISIIKNILKKIVEDDELDKECIVNELEEIEIN